MSDDAVPPPLPPPGGRSQWEGSLRPFAIAVAVFAALLIASCRYGVPVLASAAAARVPETLVDAIGEVVLASMDAGTFDPSAVPVTRQQRIVSRFSALRPPADTPAHAYEVVFRRSSTVGANAMALPSGTIVVTDGLVALTGTDDEIVAVLAHEAGHVEHRHGLRLLFQSSFVGTGLTWLLGDVSMLASTASRALLEAKYSRDFEREADAYAVAVLDRNDIPRAHLVRMLQRLQQAADAEGGSGPALVHYLSSHPLTAERVAAIGDQ